MAWVSDLNEIIWNILEVNNHIQEDYGKLVVFKGIIFHIVHPITQKYGTLGYKVSITNKTIEFLKIFTKAPRICSKQFSLFNESDLEQCIEDKYIAESRQQMNLLTFY